MRFLNNSSLFGLIIILSSAALPLTVKGEMTSANYYIFADSVGYNGGGTSTSTNYTLSDTVGEVAVGTGTSTSYSLAGGFQAANLDENLSFVISDTSLNLGTLSNSSVSSVTTAIIVTCNASAGYTVSVSDVSGNIASTVSDGTVTAGQDEYGISASGGNAAIAGDQAVVNGLILASANYEVPQTTTTIAFKASYTAATAGSYSQSIVLTASGNF